MKKKRVYLILQAAACCALTAMLAASAISIYREGMARRALDPMADIYTPQIVAQKLAPIAPLFFASLGLLIAGLALGIRGGSAEGSAGNRSAVRVNRPAEAAPQRRRGAIQAALLIAAVVFIIAGILNGSARDVLYKAITICTECVGLG